MEERLIDLESRIAFQDETIDVLNRTVMEQQQQLESLTKEVAHLRDRLKAIAPSPLDSDEPEPPPPHY